MFQEQQHNSPLRPCLLLKGPARLPDFSKRNEVHRKALAHPAPRREKPTEPAGRASPERGQVRWPPSKRRGRILGTPLPPDFRSERCDPGPAEVSRTTRRPPGAKASNAPHRPASRPAPGLGRDPSSLTCGCGQHPRDPSDQHQGRRAQEGEHRLRATAGRGSHILGHLEQHQTTRKP